MNRNAILTLLLFATVTYQQYVKPILDANCVECHSSGSPVLDLSRFPFTCPTISSQATIVDTILSKVGSNPAQMPPGNRTKLSASEVNMIQQWRDQGLAP